MNRFWAMSLQKKWIAVGLIGAFTTLGSIFFGLKEISEVHQRFVPLAEDSLPYSEHLGRALFEFREIRLQVRSTPLVGNSPNEIATYLEKTLAAVGVFEARLKNIKQFIDNEHEQKVFDRLNESWLEFFAFGGELIQVLKSKEEGSMQKAASMVRDVCPVKAKKVEDAFLEMLSIQVEEGRSRKDSAIQSFKLAQKKFFAIGLFAFVIIVMASYFVARRVSLDLAHSVTQVDQGSEKLKTLSQSLLEGLKTLVSNVQETTDSSEKVSQVATEISGKSEETQASSESVKKTVFQSMESARRGQETVKQLVEAMKSLQESNQKSAGQVKDRNQKLSSIVGLIRSVAEKTSVINDIVFQLKILSFNASVEAARAGEHGKGFAVVAEEVGNLAQMSGDAALQINDLLASSIQNVSNVVSESQNASEKTVVESQELLRHGMGVSQRCQSDLEEICQQAEKVEQAIQMISEGSLGVKRSSDEIRGRIQQVLSAAGSSENATHNFDRGVQVLSQSIQDLSMVMRGLNKMIRGEDEDGSNTAGDSQSQAREDRVDSKLSNAA